MKTNTLDRDGSRGQSLLRKRLVAKAQRKARKSGHDLAFERRVVRGLLLGKCKICGDSATLHFPYVHADLSELAITGTFLYTNCAEGAKR